MATRRGRRHQQTIDGQTVWLDSLTEAIALNRFIETYGFAGKWERPKYGIKHTSKFYTPDFELSVRDGARTSRAIVEVKQYRRDCTKDIVERMHATAKHYQTHTIFLYTVKKDQWYQLHMPTHDLEPCKSPSPGELSLSSLYRPWRFVATNHYGRKYNWSILDSLASILHPSVSFQEKIPSQILIHKTFLC